METDAPDTVPTDGQLMDGPEAMTDVSNVEALIATPEKFIHMRENDCQAMMSTMKDLSTENNQLAAVLDDVTKKQLKAIAGLRGTMKATHRAKVDTKYAKIAKALDEQSGVEREDLDKLADYYADLKVASVTMPSEAAPMEIVAFDRQMYAPRAATARFGTGEGAPSVASIPQRFGAPEEPAKPVISAGMAALTEFEKKSSWSVAPSAYLESIGTYAAPPDASPFLKEAARFASAPIDNPRAYGSDNHDLVVLNVASICELWAQYFASVGNKNVTPDSVASMLTSCAQDLSRNNLADISAAAYATETTITARR